MKNVLGFLCLLWVHISSASILPSDLIFDNPSYESMKISPDGAYISAMINLKDSYKIVAFKNDSNNALAIFELQRRKERHIYDYNWIDNDTLFIDYKKGNTNYIEFIDFSFQNDDFTINSRRVSVQGEIVDPVFRENDRFIFARIKTKNRSLEIYSMTVNELLEDEYSSDNQIDMDFENIKAFLFDNDSRVSLVYFKEDEEDRYALFDQAEKEWVTFSIEKKKDDNLSVIGVYDNQRVVLISNVDRDKSAVLLYNIKTRSVEKVLYESPIYDVEGASFDIKNKQLRWIRVVEKGVVKYLYLTKSQQNIQAESNEKLKGKNIYFIDHSLDQQHQLLLEVASDSPGRYYYFNRTSGKTKILQDKYPALSGFKFSKGEYLEVNADDGVRLEGYLYNPIGHSGDKKYPLVVMPHGGPIGVQDLNHFDPQVQFLSSYGYAVLKVNYRGSSGYGKEFLKKGKKEYGQKIEGDVNTVVDFVVNNYPVDANKMCIMGSSYGGYSALMSSIRFPDKYQCAISAFGITDLPLIYSSHNINMHKKIKSVWQDLIGDISNDKQQLMRTSPFYMHDKLSTPLLLFAGKLDRVATAEHTNRLSMILDMTNKKHDYYLYPYAGHGHDEWEGDIHMYTKIIEFLDKHLMAEREFTEQQKITHAGNLFQLGRILNEGIVIPKDPHSAKIYFEKALKLGYQAAQKELLKLKKVL